MLIAMCFPPYFQRPMAVTDTNGFTPVRLSALNTPKSHSEFKDADAPMEAQM